MSNQFVDVFLFFLVFINLELIFLKEMTSTTKNNNNNKSLRFSADTENLSSIPRLNPANQDEQVITWDELLNGAAADQQPATQVTPVKISSPKQKHSQRTRSTSSSSDDYSSRKPQSIDEDKSCTTASDILIRRLSNDNLKKPQTQSKETNVRLKFPSRSNLHAFRF